MKVTAVVFDVWRQEVSLRSVSVPIPEGKRPADKVLHKLVKLELPEFQWEERENDDTDPAQLIAVIPTPAWIARR